MPILWGLTLLLIGLVSGVLIPRVVFRSLGRARLTWFQTVGTVILSLATSYAFGFVWLMVGMKLFGEGLLQKSCLCFVGGLLIALLISISWLRATKKSRLINRF